MNFLAVFIACFGTAVAQTINIFAPKDSTTISPGPLTVTIDRPDTLTGSVEVALVLSIAPCPGGTCLDPSQRLGTTLYNGPFNPQFPPAGSGAPDTAPQQNFTVTVPSDLSGQKAILSAVHFSLVGTSPQPLFEIKSVTVNVSD